MFKFVTNRRIIDISALMISAVIIWFLYFATNFNGIPIGHSDAMNYGQIARNIVKGEGFTVNEIVPRKLLYVSDKSEYFKSIIAPPLHPLVISLFFFLFGISDTTLILSSALFFILVVPQLYLLTNDLYNRKIALVVSGLYIISLQLLWYTLSGQTESLYVFLLVAGFYAVYKSKEPWHFLIVGAILGLSWLTRVNTIFFIIPFGVYAYLSFPEKRLRNITLLLAGFIIIGSPIFYRNYHYFGDPILGWYGSAAAWGTEFNQQPLVKTSIGTSVNVIFDQPLRFITKYFSNLTSYYFGFLKFTKPLIMAFFIVSLFRWSFDERVNKFKILFLGSFLFQLLILCAYGESSRIRYFHIFIPLIIIFATEAFFFVYEKFDIKQGAVKVLIPIVLVSFLAAPLIGVTAPWKTSKSDNRTNYSWIGRFLKENTNENEIIMSNTSSAVGWYGDRKAINLPASFATVEAINKNYLKIDGILLLSSQNEKVRDYLEELSNEWKYIHKKSPPNYGGYSLVKKFYVGSIKTVLYKNIK